MVKVTEDKELISAICNHPDVFGWISDDCTPTPYVPDLAGSIWLTDETESGLISIVPWNGITCQVHMASLPTMWGSGHKMVKEALVWGFKHTGYVKVLGIVPAYNGFVIQLLKDLSFVKEGTLTGSWLKNFKKHDQIIYSISKYDFLRRA